MFTSTNSAAGRGHHSQVRSSSVQHPVHQTTAVQNYEYTNATTPRVQDRFTNANTVQPQQQHSDALVENMKGFECSDLDNALLSGQAPPPNGDFGFSFPNRHHGRAMQQARMAALDGSQNFSPMNHNRASMDGFTFDEQQGRPRSSQPAVSDAAIGDDFHQSTESVFSPTLQQNVHHGECDVDTYGRTATRRVSEPCSAPITNHQTTYQRTNSFPAENSTLRTHQYGVFPANRAAVQNGTNMANPVQTFYPSGHSNTQNVDTSLPGIYERNTDSQAPSMSPHMHGQTIGYSRAGMPTMNTSISKPMEYIQQGNIVHNGPTSYQGMLPNMTSTNTATGNRLHHLPQQAYQQYMNQPPQASPNQATASQLRGPFPPHMQPSRATHPHYVMGSVSPPYSSANYNNQRNFPAVECAKPVFQGTIQGNFNGNANVNVAPPMQSLPNLPRYPGGHSGGQPRYPAPQQGYVPNSGMPMGKAAQFGVGRGGMEFQNPNAVGTQRLRHFGPMMENGASQTRYPAEHMQGYPRHQPNVMPPNGNYSGVQHMNEPMVEARPTTRVTQVPGPTIHQQQNYGYTQVAETYPVHSGANVIPGSPGQSFPNAPANTARFANMEGSPRPARPPLTPAASFAQALQAMAKRDYGIEQQNQEWADQLGSIQNIHTPTVPDNQPAIDTHEPELSPDLAFTEEARGEKRGNMVFSAELEKLAKLSQNPAFANFPELSEDLQPPDMLTQQSDEQQQSETLSMNTEHTFDEQRGLITTSQLISDPDPMEGADNSLPSFEQLVSDRNNSHLPISKIENSLPESPPATTTSPVSASLSLPVTSVQLCQPKIESPPSVGHLSPEDFQELTEQIEASTPKTLSVEKIESCEQVNDHTVQELMTSDSQAVEPQNAVKQLQRMTQSLKEKQEEVPANRHVEYLSLNTESTSTSNENCIAALSAACRNMIADLDSPVQKSVNHQLYSVVSDNGIQSPGYEQIPNQFQTIAQGMVPSPFLPQNSTFQTHVPQMDNMSIGCSPVTDGGQQTPNSVSPGTFHLQYQNFLHDPPLELAEPKPRKKRARKRDHSQDGDEQPKRQRRKRKKAEMNDGTSIEGELNSVESSSIIGSIDEQTHRLLEEASLISESELCEQHKLPSHESSISHQENVQLYTTETSDIMLSTPHDIQSSSPLDAVTMATISSNSPALITSPQSLNSPQITSVSKSNDAPSGQLLQHPATPSNPEQSSNNNNNAVPKNPQNSETNSLGNTTEMANNILSCPSSVNSISNEREDISCTVFDGMLSRPNSSCSMEGSQSNLNCELEGHEILNPNSAASQNNGLCLPNITIDMSAGPATSIVPTYTTTMPAAGLPVGMVPPQMNSGHPVMNNNQPPEAHPLEILQAQIQLQRQQFNMSDTRPMPFKSKPKPAAATTTTTTTTTGHKTKGPKATKVANQVDVETLMAEEDSTWYMPNDAPKEPMLPWEQSKKTSEKGQSVDPNQVDRRTLHKISEQKRRESLKHSIDVLKRAVPDCRDLADQSQQNVLLRAHNYIVDMLGKQQRNKICSEEIESLKNCNNRLADEISILRQEYEILSKLP